MDASAILHVHFIAHFNAVYIATNNGVKPKTTVIARLYIANNGGIFCNKIILAKAWADSFYWEDDGHFKYGLWITNYEVCTTKKMNE